MQRLLLDLLFFGSLLWLPWWLTLLLAAALAIRARSYEVILGGVFLDALYGSTLPALGAPIACTLLCTGLFFLGEFLRPRLR